MKLLVLLSIAALSTGQEVQEPADAPAEVASVATLPYPLLYNYPYGPITRVVSAAFGNPQASRIISYGGQQFPFYQSPYFRTVSKTVEGDAAEDDALAFLQKPLLYYGSPIYANHFPSQWAYSHPSYGFPLISATPAKAETPAEEPAAIPARKKRDIQVPLPFLRAVPDTHKFEYKTNQLDATDDATPADTTKLALTTKTHEVSVPTVKYVQDVVSVKPVTYSAPLVSTAGGYYPFGYSGFSAPGHFPLSYSGLNNFPLSYSGYSGYSGYYPYASPFFQYSAVEPKAEAAAEPAAEPIVEVTSE